jgi:hypothetical protein
MFTPETVWIAAAWRDIFNSSKNIRFLSSYLELENVLHIDSLSAEISPLDKFVFRNYLGLQLVNTVEKRLKIDV